MIHRLTIANFMGIETLELTLGPDGIFIEGGNARGKTSVLKAVRAALAGQGVSPDAIRKGATSAEVVVNIDDLTVRRLIDRNGTSLVVKGPPDGKPRPAPKEVIAALLGASPVDPLDVFLAKPRERRAAILSALPVTVTEEQLRRWVPESLHAHLFEVLGTTDRDLPGTLVTAGHGLEVVDRVRSALHARRAEANKAVVARRRAAEDASALRARTEAELSSAEKTAPAPGLGVEDAEEALRSARTRRAELDALSRAADRATAAQEGTRRRIAELRAEASKVRAEAPLAPDGEAFERMAHRIVGHRRVAESKAEEVENLRAALRKAEEELRLAREDLAEVEAEGRALEERQNAAADAVERAVGLEGQAMDLEAAIGTEPERASEEVLRAVDDAIFQAAAEVEAARARRLSRNALDALRDETVRVVRAAEAAARELLIAEEHAEELDRAVKVLLKDAPAELLAGADGIPGLSVEGDAVLLHGVDVERLSSAEQMRLAVEVAKRPQRDASTKLLVVDGLERLDPEQGRAFVALTEGFQVFATRVTSGDLRVRPLRELTGGEGGAS